MDGFPGFCLPDDLLRREVQAKKVEHPLVHSASGACAGPPGDYASGWRVGLAAACEQSVSRPSDSGAQRCLWAKDRALGTIVAWEDIRNGVS